MAETQVDKLLYAWALLQRRVNSTIPSTVYRLQRVANRARGGSGGGGARPQ